MIEELISQIEKEFETETADETKTTEPADETETTDNVETDETDVQETDETQAKPVSIVQTIVEQLEREMTEDEPAESDSDDDEPSESVEQGGQDVSDETESDQLDDEPSADESESDQLDESEPTDETDEGKPTEQDDSGDEQDEPNDQLTELMDELQTKSKKLDDERVKLLERVEEAEQRAEQSERQMKRLVLSHALANRDDIVDGRLIAELVDVDSLDVEEGKTIEEAVTNRINDVVQKYGNVLAKKKGEKYVARDIGGITTYEKLKPIGKPSSRAQDEPFNSKQELLEEARQKAEKGGQKERVEYLALRRKYGL